MPKVLIIDTETGGLDPAACSVLSIAAVVWDDGRLLDEAELFVREPHILADAESLKINAIDPAWLENHGLPPVAVVSSLRSLITKHFGGGLPRRVTIAGHNVSFDIGFLKRLYRMAGEDYGADFSHRSLDTSSMVALLMLAGLVPLAAASSNNAFEYFGIDVPSGKRHTALADARATAELLSRLVSFVTRNAAAAHIK